MTVAPQAVFRLLPGIMAHEDVTCSYWVEAQTTPPRPFVIGLTQALITGGHVYLP